MSGLRGRSARMRAKLTACRSHAERTGSIRAHASQTCCQFHRVNFFSVDPRTCGVNLRNNLLDLVPSK